MPADPPEELVEALAEAIQHGISAQEDGWDGCGTCLGRVAVVVLAAIPDGWAKVDGHMVYGEVERLRRELDEAVALLRGADVAATTRTGYDHSGLASRVAAFLAARSDGGPDAR